MYEPYLNREKQYLKMNAELDNRFKEIDHTKSELTTNAVKPRLNVFGNGSKVNQFSKLSHAAKQKRNEIKCVTVSKLSEQNALRETATIIDKVSNPQKSKTSATNSRSIQGNDIFTNKQSNSDSSFVISGTPSQAPLTTIPKSNVTPPMSPKNDRAAAVKKNISSDGLIKFLKSKVAILKQELDLSQQENVKNIRAFESSLESNKKNIAQIGVVSYENDTLKIQVDKLRKSIITHEAVAKEKDADLATLNKEITTLRKQLRDVNRLYNNLEKRFLKCQDDLEHTKKNLNNAQECEHQQRAVNHQQKNFFEDQIKIMSKQRAGLISAYKKQLLLLDNLKRQNLCLEQSKLLQLAEKDFVKVLDWTN